MQENKKLSRENRIMSLINASGKITTEEASRVLGVSPATARRMFAQLEKSGRAVRTYGGVRTVGNFSGYSFEQREKENARDKELIGALAASLVNDGDTVYLDCGTTVLQMALALGTRVSDGELSSLNVVTNSLANLQALAPRDGCRVILVGGEYNSGRRDFSGTLTERYVSPFHFSKCFLGCDGADAESGFFSNQFDISSLNSAVLGRTDAAYVLLDGSKFGRRSLMTYASFSEINAVVTSAAPCTELAQAFERAGTRVLIAD